MQKLNVRAQRLVYGSSCYSLKEMELCLSLSDDTNEHLIEVTCRLRASLLVRKRTLICNSNPIQLYSKKLQSN